MKKEMDKFKVITYALIVLNLFQMFSYKIPVFLSHKIKLASQANAELMANTVMGIFYPDVDIESKLALIVWAVDDAAWRIDYLPEDLNDYYDNDPSLRMTFDGPLPFTVYSVNIRIKDAVVYRITCGN